MDWQEAIKATHDSLALLGWRALGAVAVLFAGLVLAFASRPLIASLARRGFRSKAYRALPGIIWLAIAVLTLVLMLVVLGVAGPVIGFVVTIGVALGLFTDSFGGLRILVSRPFEIGDTIEIVDKKIEGMVVETTLVGTRLWARDGSQILVPNGMLFNNPIRNHSSPRSRGLLTFEFIVKPKGEITDLEKMVSAMIESTAGLDNSGFEISVTRIDPDAVTLKVRVATAPEVRERVASDFLKTANTQFEASGVAVRSLALLKR